MISAPPRGWQRVTWLGPGFLWMVSAAGSGELLFTPRVGSQYGYALLWAMCAAILLKWIINREVGRYAVCAGETLIAGFGRLPGPRKWAVWVVLVPQLFVAVAAIAGMAGSASTALILVLPGDVRLWMIVAVAASTTLVVLGGYGIIERTATIIGVALAVAAVAAAVSVGPDLSALAAGLRPQWPANADHREVLPWLGFMLSGAAGMIWYSHWIVAKGYGGKERAGRMQMSAADRDRLRGWVGQMTFDNTVAVAGTFVVAGAFLVLGTELLRPAGVVPEEQRVAATLGRMLGDVWGPTGYWFMVAAVFVGFWDTVLADQDGHARMFTDGARQTVGRIRRTGEQTVRRIFVVVVAAAAPVALYLAVGEPVELLKVAGAIEAAHIPFVAGLTLYLNRTTLPGPLRPSWPAMIATLLAACFFTAFAGFYAVEVFRGRSG